MWCWCGGWKGMKRWHALGILVAGLLRCHSFCEYCVSFWRNRTWRRTWDLINFYPWYRHQKSRRHLSWCEVGFVVSVVLEAPIFWKCQKKTQTHGVDPVLLNLCRPGTCFLVFGSLISSWSVPRYWYYKPMPWDGDKGLEGVSCDHAGNWREYVQYYVHYHDIHWNPDIPDILWQYLYINILAWCNYESWSSCRPCRYITSKQAWIEWCCYLPRREAQRRLDLVLSQRSIRPRDWHWLDSWQALKLQQVTFTKPSSDSRPFNTTKPPNLQTQKSQPFSPRNGFPPMFLRMDLWGEDFEILYKRLETEGKGRKTVKAQHLWFLCHQKIWGTWYMEMIDWCICVSFWDWKDSG